ncbi:acetyltransferase [Streptomyces abyssalis]|uniref:Acetyltransferase n=1 Tax=Streptomyces abyssalis TaxID=933944 RepID=A0A1E7JS20_9ACTN|nr:GNAT family N-acetyltransferase [Streptomyces abyssalis]OEU91647.1 acetyltransferase [Streptomyces abyssalis]OEU94216.1 acetyltransferase [Streptomyces abyssalis]OEV28198.1 acetyltransferase [Streptomyces nanshensis]
MRIRECREEDVALLDEHMPSPGAACDHASRFVRHLGGGSTLLVAWRGELPVGSCEIRWEGCRAPEVRAVHPECSEISGLGLWPEALRSQRVGTALIHAAERLVLGRGRVSVGLGVEKNNPRTQDLYKRLGYRPSTPYLDCGSYEDSAGLIHRVADACTFMVKDLDPAGPVQVP